MTLGEKRIRTEFNPSNDSVVQHIKERGAEFINYINDNIDSQKFSEPSEVARLKAMALTAIEEATMYAVKAETSNK
jgi:hypothetical protein